MIEFNNISKKFKNDFWAKEFLALDDVSFKIKKGKITGFLGANGAGKTTSMKILMTFIKQTSGEVLFNSDLGKDEMEIISNIGHVPERPYFYGYLTGNEFLHYMGKLNNIGKLQLFKAIGYWSEKLDIDFALNRKIRGYSKGMLQRLGIVSSLIHDPDFLVFDEPLSGLDPNGRKLIKDILLELNDAGKTIFFSSHIVSDIEEICSDIVVLDHGKLIYQGEVSSLVDKYSTQKYICNFRLNNLKSLTIDNINYELVRSSGDSHTVIVNKDEKKNLSLSIFKSGGDIISLNSEKPTLEKILYEIKK